MNITEINYTDFDSKYFIYAFILTIGLRLVFSMLRALEASYKKRDVEDLQGNEFIKRTWISRTWIIFIGLSKKDPNPDFWYNTILGTFELLAFPILMKTNSWEAIGAWIGFKAIAQWSTWTKDRLVFNRFLIANVIVLTVSFLILKDHIIK